MIRKLISSLQKPYPLNIDFNRVLPFILAFGFFISIFLIIFQPFGLNNYHSPDKTLQLIGMGFIVTILLSVNLLAIPKIISSVFSEDRWNIGREITWNIWLSVTTILGSSFYWVLVTGQTVSAAYIYRASLNSLVFTLFLTPISVLCVMSNYIRSLKRKLERAEEVTRSLQSSQTKSFTHPLELLSETGKEKLKMPVDKLLFIQSCDNYANVVRQKNGSTTEKLLRSSLKNIEEQITFTICRAVSPIFHCEFVPGSGHNRQFQKLHSFFKKLSYPHSRLP